MITQAEIFDQKMPNKESKNAAAADVINARNDIDKRSLTASMPLFSFNFPSMKNPWTEIAAQSEDDEVVTTKQPNNNLKPHLSPYPPPAPVISAHVETDDDEVVTTRQKNSNLKPRLSPFLPKFSKLWAETPAPLVDAPSVDSVADSNKSAPNQQYSPITAIKNR